MRERAARPRTPRWAALCVCLVLVSISFTASSAQAAGPPLVLETSATDLQGTSALLTGRIDPAGLATEYRFQYVDRATYEADSPAGFAAAAETPAATIPAGSEPRPVSAAIAGLDPGTAYEYRLLAQSSGGTASGPPQELTTTAGFGLLPGAQGFAAAALTSDQAGAPAATLAGSHPFELRAEANFRLAGPSSEQPGLPVSDGDLRAFELDLPPGLFANPLALPRCTEAELHTPRVSPYEASAAGESCDRLTQIGVITIETSLGGGSTRSFGLFNLDPPPGYPAEFGFNAYGVPVTIRPELSERGGVFALRLTLRDFPQSYDLYGFRFAVWGVPWDAGHDGQRANCLNEADPQSPHAQCGIEPPQVFLPTEPYLTLPASCSAPLQFTLHATSWQQPGGAQATSGQPPLQHCEEIGFEPAPVARLSLSRTTSPTGFDFTLTGNAAGLLRPEARARAQTRTATVTLPEGVTINPSLGAGLGVCTPAQFAAEAGPVSTAAGCPNSAKIGELTIESPLIEAPIPGSVYLAQPDDTTTAAPGAENPFDALIAVYLVARSPEQGLQLRTEAEISADPSSGRLITRFDDLPQLPYSRFNVHFRDGQRSPLATPARCGIYKTQVELSSWLSAEETLTSNAPFGLDSGIGGGPCPTAPEPFAPQAVAGTLNRNAGAYTPFYLHLTRTDAEREITSYSAELPPGLLGNLSAVPYCPDAAIAAARRRTASAEAADPSCPAATQIGHTVSGYGLGSDLAYATGGLYMAGPYGGQPFSIVAIDSAQVGPFDLGVVIVRSAIRVNPLTAQVTIDSAASDPIPHILGGIPLHLRDIRVYIDRPHFTLNPTSCARFTALSRLTGVAPEESGPAAAIGAGVPYPFQVSNCSALGFKPRFALRLRGGRRRGDFPRLTAILRPRPGDANLSAVSVTMPPTAFLAQSHLRSICPRAQFASERCPPASLYGRASAITPLLDQPLTGPVYLRSSDRALPDLVAKLSGAGVSVEVVGRIDTKNGGLRARFSALPDAPVQSFVMHLDGGAKGLIENAAESTCSPIQHASVAFLAQSNRAVRLSTPLSPAGCPHHRHHRSGRGR